MKRIPLIIVLSFSLIYISTYFEGTTRIASNLFKISLVLGLFYLCKKRECYLSNILLISIIFLFYNFISVFFTEKIQTSLINKHFTYSLYILLFIYILGGMYLYFNLYKERVKYLLLIPVFCALISIIYFLLDGDTGRLVSSFKSVHPIHDATLFSIPSVYIIYQFKFKNSPLTSWILAICLLILEYCIMLSSSRSVILSISTLTFLFCIIVKDKRASVPLMTILISFTLYKLTGVFLSDSQITHFESMQQLLGRSDAGRLTLWRHMISEMSMCDLIFGKGFLFNHSFVEKMGSAFVHPHSAFMHSLFHGGLILLSFHILMLVEVFKTGYQEYKMTGDFFLVLFAVSSLAPMLFNGIAIYGVDDRFNELVMLFWIMIGISIHKEKKILGLRRVFKNEI